MQPTNFASTPDPDVIIRQIHGDILRGDLRKAQSEVADQRAKFAGYCADCGERLRLIEAELLQTEGRSSDVVRLLCSRSAPPLRNHESEIKGNLYCGLAHFAVGQSQLADQELPEAQRLAEVNHSPLLAEVLQATGNIALHRSQIQIAEQAFTKSLEIARQQGDQVLQATDLLDLGDVALESERFGDALDRFNASSQIAQSIHAQAVLEQDLGNIGWAYYKLGDYEVALTKTRQAEEQAEKLGASLTPIFWLKHASLCRQQLGDLSGADADYQKALVDAQRIGNKRLISGIYWGIALVDMQRGQLDAAKLQAEQAYEAAAVSGDKLTALDATLLQGLIAERQHNDTQAMLKFKEAYQGSSGSPSIRWNIENAIAKLNARGVNPKQAEAWFRKSIATFEAERNSVQSEELKLPFFSNGDGLYRDYAAYLVASNKSDEALHLLDLGRARSLSDGLQTASGKNQVSRDQRVNPSSIAASEGAVILFYSLGHDKSWLWAIDSAHTQLFTLPGKPEIESRVTAYQKAILRSSDPLHDQNVEARALYDAIVAPAASMLLQGAKVIVIPDGALNQLNFETLLVPGKSGPHYWIEDVTITNANAIRLLPRSKPPVDTNTEKTLLLMGNPVASGTAFANLPHAAAEMESIGRRFPANDRKILTQAAAMPAAYSMSRPEQFSYIHFVAHGTASQLSPLDSAVVLSPSRENPDNYKLYARDIVRQPIHADLVTISACVGSGVRSYAGEGLVGLSWAFLRAGSHNVIGALWDVDDASTPELMDELYRGLRSGNGPDTALRNAKLMLIHSDGVYRKPLYWAAFQLYAGS